VGTIYVITGNLSSHDSKSTRAWLQDHPRIRPAFIPKGACWLNLQEGWWRIFEASTSTARRGLRLLAELGWAKPVPGYPYMALRPERT
jgi:DDE superfamily endonuclease